MTIFQYALIRFARQAMTHDEVMTAQTLAEKADAGSASAETALKLLCDAVIKRKRLENSDGETGGSDERQ